MHLQRPAVARKIRVSLEITRAILVVRFNDRTAFRSAHTKRIKAARSIRE